MIINFVKLFPLSCEQVGLKELHINIYDIKNFRRVEERQIGFATKPIINDIINMDGLSYRLPGLDNGLEILTAITDNLNIVRMYDSTKDFLKSENVETEKEKAREAALQLNEYILKYQ